MEFAVIRALTPDPETAYFPREKWGTQSMGTSSPDGRLDIEVTRAPEGLIFIARCTECGARAERLVDFRLMDEKEKRESAPGERFLQIVESAMEPIVHGFVDAHKNCTEEDGPRLPPLAVRTARAAIEEAERRLRRGKGVRPALTLLCGQHVGLKIPMEDIPTAAQDEDEHFIQMAALKSATRDLIKARKLPLTAAVYVSEAWAAPDSTHGQPHSHPEKQEVLIVVALSDDVGRMGMAEIIRTSGRPEDGPGRLGKFIWTPLRSRSFVDGLFALNAPFELDEETLRRAAGDLAEPWLN